MLREIQRGVVGTAKRLFGEILPGLLQKTISGEFYKANGRRIIESAKEIWRCIRSSDHRLHRMQSYFGKTIDSWVERKQLDPEGAQILREQSRAMRPNSYLADFAVHSTIIYPLGKVLEYTVPALLWAVGVASATQAGLGVLLGGAVLRTLYTLGRTLTAAPGQRPWIALAVGTLPMVGSAAYLVQMAVSTTGSPALSKFLIYDLFTKIGTNLPIWGGRDTLTEHFFNRIPTLVLGRQHRGRGERV